MIWRTRKARMRVPASISLPFKSINVLLLRSRPQDWWSSRALWSRSIKGKLLFIQSTTLVIAYLIKYKGMSFLHALRFVKSKRPQVCPNLGFELQLKAYEKTHHTTGNQMLFTIKKKERKELP
jgi:hypothetical protein